MNQFFRRSLICMSALTLSYSLPAAAVDFCVATGAQLNTALLTAATNGTNDVIKIQSGILIGPSNQTFGWLYRPRESDSAATLRITGGFASGCAAANPVGTADATQLDARNLGAIFSLDTDGDFTENGIYVFPIGAFTGQITLENLTMARGATATNAVSVSFGASNLTSGGKLTLRNTFITSSNTSVATVVMAISPGGNALFQNNVVFNNNHSGGAVRLSALVNSFMNVSNNSIYGNTGNDVTEGLNIGGTITLFNNVVADNSSTLPNSREVVCQGACLSVSLRNNHFETSQYTGAGVFSDIGTTTGDPQWTASGSVRVPNAVSPLRDSGNNTPSGGLLATDILGNPRLINGIVDRGAVEAAAAMSNPSPTVSPVSPTPNTTTNLGSGFVGQLLGSQIILLATGGNGVGVTSVFCQSDGPPSSLAVLSQGFQSVAVGQALQPVNIGFLALQAGFQQGSITCSVNPLGAPPMYQFTYGFSATGIDADAVFANGFE